MGAVGLMDRAVDTNRYDRRSDAPVGLMNDALLFSFGSGSKTPNQEKYNLMGMDSVMDYLNRFGEAPKKSEKYIAAQKVERYDSLLKRQIWFQYKGNQQIPAGRFKGVISQLVDESTLKFQFEAINVTSTGTDCMTIGKTMRNYPQHNGTKWGYRKLAKHEKPISPVE